jgi:predicted lipid-binding transport protein (Tim44 family)
MADVAQLVEHQVVVLRVAGSSPVVCPIFCYFNSKWHFLQTLLNMDILFFAALAVFIFFKLREQLGKVDEEKKRDLIRNFIKEQTKTTDSDTSKNQPKLVAIPGVGIVSADAAFNPIDEKSQKILDTLNGDLKTNLTLVLERANLSPNQFLEGAKSAFEIILSSFSIGDLPALKPLLSEKIFLQFQTEIENRKKNEQSLNTKIISIDESKIIDAKMIGDFAQISLTFVSKQINYITDSKNEVVVGSKTEISTVNDKCTFKKDCNSPNPNWLLVSTS